jgi:ribosome-associated heat shock protein Hsp15
MAGDDGNDGAVRLDKWLWAARFFKTRSLAAAAVERGQVRVAEERVKPARTLRISERLVVQRGDETHEIVVAGLSTVRGPASVARLLYDETPASLERRVQAKESRRLAKEPAAAIKGRPSKRDARSLRRLAAIQEHGSE